MLMVSSTQYSEFLNEVGVWSGGENWRFRAIPVWDGSIQHATHVDQKLLCRNFYFFPSTEINYRNQYLTTRTIPSDLSSTAQLISLTLYHTIPSCNDLQVQAFWTYGKKNPAHFILFTQCF